MSLNSQENRHSAGIALCPGDPAQQPMGGTVRAQSFAKTVWRRLCAVRFWSTHGKNYAEKNIDCRR